MDKKNHKFKVYFFLRNEEGYCLSAAQSDIVECLPDWRRSGGERRPNEPVIRAGNNASSVQQHPVTKKSCL